MSPRADLLTAVVSICLSALAVGALFRLRRSFGGFTERIERASVLTRQSNESAVQRVGREADRAEKAKEECRAMLDEIFKRSA